VLAAGAMLGFGPVTGAVCWPAEAADWPAEAPDWAAEVPDRVGWAAGWTTGTIAPGASMAANRDQAPYQPSGVSGHRSKGCAPATAAGHIP
jgi:hypothetical protein